MAKEPEISRRGFGKLLGGLLGGSLVKQGKGHPVSDINPNNSPENSDYRIVSIADGYEDLNTPYDVEIKIEYGDPQEDVSYNRFLFEKNDLEESELSVATEILDYVRSKKHRADDYYIEKGRQIFKENFDTDLAENHFARRIGETLEIEKKLEINSVEEFDESISKLQKGMGIKYENGEFKRNRYSQPIQNWMKTGW